MNVGGVCECPELSSSYSDECVTKAQCLSGAFSIIGSRCLKGDCSTNLKEPSCTSPSGFVQCGSGQAVETCLSSIGCYYSTAYVEKCEVYDKQEQCDAICRQPCKSRTVTITHSRPGYTKYYAEVTSTKYVCENTKKSTQKKSRKTSSAGSFITCEANKTQFGKQVKVQTICPAVTGCYEGGCAAAVSAISCKEFCQVECIESWKSGVQQQLVKDQ